MYNSQNQKKTLQMEGKDIAEIPAQMASTPVKRRMSFMDMNPQADRPKRLRLQNLNRSLPDQLMSTSLNLTTFDNFVAYRGRFQKVLDRRRRFSSVLPLRERFDKALETHSTDTSIRKHEIPSPIRQPIFDNDSKLTQPIPASESVVLTLSDTSQMSWSYEDDDDIAQSEIPGKGRSLFSVAIHPKGNLDQPSQEIGSTRGGNYDVDTLESSIVSLDESELRYVHGCSSALLAASASKDQRNARPKPSSPEVPFHATCPSPQGSQKRNICDFPTYRFCFEFTKPERLSDSRFGLVFAARSRIDGNLYCIKKSRGSGDQTSENVGDRGPFYHEARDELLAEVKALSSLPSHNNVIRFYSSWIEYDCVYIQVEYCNGGSLLDYLQLHPTGKSLVKFRLLQLMGDVGSAVQHLNENGMVHLDLTPGNILVQSPSLLRWISGLDLPDQRQIRKSKLEHLMEDPKERLVFKLADFGRCRRHTQSDIFEEVGDPQFMPPEVYGGVNGANTNDVDVFKIDVFSLGMTLYCAMGGEPIARIYEDPNQLLYKRMRLPSHADSQISKFVQRMMMPIHLRPSIDSVLNFPGVCEASWSHQCLLKRISLLSKRTTMKNASRNSTNRHS